MQTRIEMSRVDTRRSSASVGARSAYGEPEFKSCHVLDHGVVLQVLIQTHGEEFPPKETASSLKNLCKCQSEGHNMTADDELDSSWGNVCAG